MVKNVLKNVAVLCAYVMVALVAIAVVGWFII